MTVNKRPRGSADATSALCCFASVFLHLTTGGRISLLLAHKLVTVIAPVFYPTAIFYLLYKFEFPPWSRPIAFRTKDEIERWNILPSSDGSNRFIRFSKFASGDIRKMW